jgi:hypothetical protein
MTRGEAERLNEYGTLKAERDALKASVAEWASFVRNVKEARTFGYDEVCSECGAGLTDDTDQHDTRCSRYVDDA